MDVMDNISGEKNGLEMSSKSNANKTPTTDNNTQSRPALFSPSSCAIFIFHLLFSLQHGRLPPGCKRSARPVTPSPHKGVYLFASRAARPAPANYLCSTNVLHLG